MRTPLGSLRRFVRPAALTAATLIALLAAALWVDSYSHHLSLDPVMLEHRSASESTTKEGTLFSYRGGVGVLLRRRFIPVDWEIAAHELGWSVYGPSLSTGRSLARDEYSIGEPVIDVAGVYLGTERGPHPGFGPNSLVVDHVVALPLWLVTLIAGAWPVRVLVRRLRRRARAGGAAFDVLPTADNPAPLSHASMGS